jgi:hypothetical protein
MRSHYLFLRQNNQKHLRSNPFSLQNLSTIPTIMSPPINMTAAGLEQLVKEVSRECTSHHLPQRRPSKECPCCEDVNRILMISSWLKSVESILYEQLDTGVIEEENFNDKLQKESIWARQEVELVLVKAEIRRLKDKVEKLESQAKL